MLHNSAISSTISYSLVNSINHQQYWLWFLWYIVIVFWIRSFL